MKQVHLLAAAEEEMNASAQYYENQLTGLGYRFLTEIERTIDATRAYPDSGSIMHPNIRRKLLRHFPFALLYRNTPEKIIILAVMHQHRKPDYWRTRTD